jgi:hypothetical protein
VSSSEFLPPPTVILRKLRAMERSFRFGTRQYQGVAEVDAFPQPHALRQWLPRLR